MNRSACRIIFRADGPIQLQTLANDRWTSYSYEHPEDAAFDFLYWWDGDPLENPPDEKQVAIGRHRHTDVVWDEPMPELLRKLRLLASWTDQSFTFGNMIHQLRSPNVLREDSILAVH